MIWFTSDTHFGHENVLKFTDRPWETIWQMNDAIVDNINGRVAVDDELYILGDFSFKMTAQDAYALRKRIACRRIHLVPGNHDKGLDLAGGRWRLHRGAADLRAQDRRAEDRPVPLPHGRLAGYGPWIVAPPRTHPQRRRRVQRVQPQAGPFLRYDVGCDANGHSPVSLDELREWFAGVDEPCDRVKWPWWVNETGDRQVERELAAYKRKEQS